jgi:polyisoprenoid-binding protein YceI
MATATWNIDAVHSGIHFSIRHLVIAKVRGKFTKFSGALEVDDADMTKSKVSVDVDVASIDTAEAQRDGHLKSPDFFDVEKFPKATFVSKSITKNGDNYDVKGDFTLHGVTKEITLHATFEGIGKDPWGGDRIGFQAKTTIVREDFGLKWNQVLEAGGVAVGPKAELEIDVEAVKAKA